MRVCLESDDIYYRSRTTCLPAADNLLLNKTNGEFCSYTCKVEDRSCVFDSDCNPNECCSVL